MVSRLIRKCCHSYSWAALSALLTLCSALPLQPAFAVAPVQTDPPNLGAVPPDLSAGVDPNVLLTFDNSGSMASQFIPDNASNTNVRRFYASEWNKIFYNPASRYRPALLPDGTSMESKTATVYTAALKDGVCTNRPAGGPASCATGLSGTVNLQTNFDNTYGAGARTASGQSAGAVDGFYMVNSNTAGCVISASNPNPADACYTIVKMSGQSAAQQKNFAIWYSYYRFRNVMARTGISRSFATLGNNIRVAWQNIGRDASVNTTLLNDNNTAAIDTFADPLRANFFNWLYANTADINTPNRAALIRGGQFFTQGAGGVKNTTNPYWDQGLGKELTCRQNFHMLVTDGYWNEQNPSLSSTLNPVDATVITPADNVPQSLPDGTAYDPTKQVAFIFGKEDPRGSSGCSNTTASQGGVACVPNISDIAWHYWSTDLRPDLTNNVPTYFPDLTTGVTGSTPYDRALPPGNNLEIYFNPSNDPSTWQHLVQYIIGLGVPGTTAVPSASPPAQGATGVALGDYLNLRKGTTTSDGAFTMSAGAAVPPIPNATDQLPNGYTYSGSGWPTVLNNSAVGLDDTWHATLNGRGGYFNAGNPDELAGALANVLNSISSRSTSSTSEAVSTSILNQGTFGYTGGYDSGSWSGYLYKLALDPDTAIAISASWDAGCKLTGGTFTPIAPTVTSAPRGSCNVPTPPPAYSPTARVIFTASTSGAGSSAGQTSTLAGKPFLYSSLTATDKGYMDLDPTSTDPNGTTGVVSGTADGNGTDRVDYLRGLRDHETAPTAEAQPRQFRARTSLLGAIINSQAVFEGGPSSGLSDIYPANSPEELAALPCTGGLTAAGCYSYERFVKDNENRTPLVYVGANDGMLHAFDAGTGVEAWAYVPNMLYRNGQLGQLTNAQNTGGNGLIASVDDTPIIQDMFLNDNRWHTILIGSMRLGGRGIYALDITNPANFGSEPAAANNFKWEFSNADDNDLGYTYASTNAARLHNGKWVVLVASGYFPNTLQVNAKSAPGRNLTPDTAPAATANITHLWVLDANNGSVIRKLDTLSGTTSFGLSTPNVVDFGLDQLDDVAVAGDLAGNVWRFDLSDKDPANWRVDNLFQTYAAGTVALCSAANPTGIGCEPIMVQPEAFADPSTGSVIYVFGSGKYLSKDDKTAASVLTTQHFFGVRDYGPGPNPKPKFPYPMHQSDLVTQTVTQTGAARFIASGTVVPNSKAGWVIPLNIPSVLGERVVVKATPIFSAGIAILFSLIPNPTDDPCVPKRTGAVMAVNAATGGPAVVPPGTASGTAVFVGAQVNNPPATGGGVVISPVGGGSIIIPGIGVLGGPGNSSFTISGALPIWRRTSWRELLNDL